MSQDANPSGAVQMYLGRSDMFRLSLLLTDTSLNLGQRLALPGASQPRIRVGALFSSATNKPLKSCFIDSTTQVVFRSESTRNYVLVEVAQEMWHFEEDGSMLLSKCEMFLAELMGKWQPRAGGSAGRRGKALPATAHTVSVILYGRVIYDSEEEGEEARAPLQRLEDGTLYRDFYKVRPTPHIVAPAAADHFRLVCRLSWTPRCTRRRT